MQMCSIYVAVVGAWPDHARIFTAVLNIGGKPYVNGSGHSKKEAEQEAAADAWRLLSGTTVAAAAPAAEGASPESSRSV